MLAILVLAAIPIPGVGDVLQAIQLAEAVKVLHDIDRVLDKIDGHAGSIQDRLALVYPNNVVDKLIGGRMAFADSMMRVVQAMACPWKFSVRVKGLEGLYHGGQIDKDLWERLIGPATALPGSDLEDFWDWESVSRMNLISAHVQSGERHQLTATWLADSAVIGADIDAAVKARTGGSPGFAQRITAMASAQQGAIAAETGDILVSLLQLDQARLMRKQKERRDEAMVAYAIYDGMGRRTTKPVVLPTDLLR